MKIGIGFNYPIKNFSIFNNRTIQNIFYLYLLLKNISDDVSILNFGIPIEQMNSEISLRNLFRDFNIINLNDIKNRFDILIEVDRTIPDNILSKFKSLGSMLISYRTDNPYYSDVNAILSNSSRPTFNNIYDEIWIQSDKNQFNKKYLEKLYNTEIYQMPFIYDDIFMKKYTTYLSSKGKSIKHEGYSGKSKDITIFEHNNNSNRTSLIPLLIIDQVYKERPENIKNIRVLNSYKFKDNKHFISFVNNLQIKKDKKVTFEDRYNTPIILSDYTDVVVSHQNEDQLNNLFFDVLYGNYPLIHNSNHLTDMYKYNGSDIDEGKNKLIYALTSHKKRIQPYKNKNLELFNKHSVNNSLNLNFYKERLLKIGKK